MWRETPSQPPAHPSIPNDTGKERVPFRHPLGQSFRGRQPQLQSCEKSQVKTTLPSPITFTEPRAITNNKWWLQVAEFSDISYTAVDNQILPWPSFSLNLPPFFVDVPISQMALEQLWLISIQGALVLKIGNAWHLFWWYLDPLVKFS